MYMETIADRQKEVIEEFSLFEDWMQRYEHMIELGKTLPLISKEHKTEKNIITGCQSKVWLHAELNEGKVKFLADSEAIITRTYIETVLSVPWGVQSKEIVDIKNYFQYKKNL